MLDHRSYKQGGWEAGGGGEGSETKRCVECGTSKTPLWRSGPAGPKSLCNACGIKSRKKRGSAMVVTEILSGEKKAKKLLTRTQSLASTSSSSSSSNFQSNRNSSSNNSKLSQMPKKKLVPLGQGVVFQKSIAERLRKRLGEEEQAAMLLMAMSCGYVY